MLTQCLRENTLTIYSKIYIPSISQDLPGKNYNNLYYIYKPHLSILLYMSLQVQLTQNMCITLNVCGHRVIPKTYKNETVGFMWLTLITYQDNTGSLKKRKEKGPSYRWNPSATRHRK